MIFVLARSAWDLDPSARYGHLGFGQEWAQKASHELGLDASGHLENDN